MFVKCRDDGTICEAWSMPQTEEQQELGEKHPEWRADDDKELVAFLAAPLKDIAPAIELRDVINALIAQHNGDAKAWALLCERHKAAEARRAEKLKASGR